MNPPPPEPEPSGPSLREKPRRRLWLWWLVGLGGVVVVGVLLARRHEASSAAKAAGARDTGKPQPVVSAVARTRDVPVHLAGLGAVTPTSTVTVRTRVDGQLMRVAFREGQLVKEGQLLAEIDPRPFQVQLEQALGQLRRDEALLANARVDLRRYTTLFSQDSVSQQTLQTQRALVHQYEGNVKADQGTVASARLNLTYARVTSPVSGRVGLRLVDPGNIVHAADANGLVVVNTEQPIAVIFSVPEDRVPELLSRLATGQTLAVRAFDRTGTKLLANGTLLTVDNQIDPTTGTVRLKATFPNSDFALFPQQFVNAWLMIDTLRGATVVPTAAIQHGVNGAFVYRVQSNDTVQVVPVKTGPSDGDDTVASTGLQPGDLVVVEGADKLTNGAPVKLQSREPGPAVGGSGRDGGQEEPAGVAPDGGR
ncbi:multidrug transporter subunit MdtA [Corallococcus sp. H22C18031201]|nr:multidrug transporter subunit MdtA [Corallococcus sp. H22C18031201]